MKLFLDANILVSVLNKEYPCFTHSSRILSLSGHASYQLYTSPICLAIAFYFAEKKTGTASAKSKIALLVANMKICSVSPTTVFDCLKNKKVTDFEDGLEYYSAIEAGCHCIITENIKDFYFSDIEVLNAEDFLKRYFPYTRR
ncbi:MAG TPA: PIN domain-containing protein [Cytophagaceae bacterium]|jgi:predicted nucleic acid-binding protein|nr:PIN domain-containing protein [Cytophagaceae bacterium]